MKKKDEFGDIKKEIRDIREHLESKHDGGSKKLGKNSLNSKNERKFLRIQIAKKSICGSFVLILVSILSIFSLEQCKGISSEVIDYHNKIITGLLAIITLALGFVAGSSID